MSQASAAVPASAAAASAAPAAPASATAAGGATDYTTMYRAMTTPQLISEAWEKTEDPAIRDKIVASLIERTRLPESEGGGATAWPSAPIAAREEAAGLYPDPQDPQFAARLFSKREFFEARAIAASVADGTIDPCTNSSANAFFDLTPVQRIVSRFMNPATPYQGLLLYHGVGVGKTCSAVTIAEQFLEHAPTMKVIVIVPQALQENFKRTVFDFSAPKLQWDAVAGRWNSQQCTGSSYLERLGLMENPDLRAVTFKVEEDRRSRYSITGYQSFANWVERTLKKSVPSGLTDPVLRAAAENEVLRQLFSDHLILVDEAHNLRDTKVPGGAADTDNVTGGDAADAAGGKALNPYLRRIVLNSEGLRVVLMTATPMYNSAPEIVLLLNYLIMNDTKSESRTLRITDLFDKDGALKPTGPARKMLERAARAYVSYMRGENPYTFPLRMHPAAASVSPVGEWPLISATKKPVSLVGIAGALNAMPLVFTEPVPGSPPDRLLRAATVRTIAAAAVEGKESEEEGKDSEEEEEEEEPEAKTTDVMLDLRMQMANISYSNTVYGTAGWDIHFNRQIIQTGGRKLRVFAPKADFAVDSIFAGEGLRAHAPKIHKVVESIRRAHGICFAYSRYIKAGALPLAIALERAGFQRRMADGRRIPLLTGIPPAAPVCALCGNPEAGDHGTHPFRPACYVLLTSEDELSPSFAGLVKAASSWPSDPEWGPEGGYIKVIIGSQVASEGLDLKCVREMHILDAWYHLNRTDQIIGRAIRYCSHSALRAAEKRDGLPSMALNNCLVYLHALRGGNSTEGPAFETADMYAYRVAIEKAQRVGVVQRLLKKNAWDCNLELEVITFTGLPPRVQIDAQGRILEEYSINDQDYTSYCDYQTCKHECAVTVSAATVRLDESTFGVEDARRIILAKQDAVRHLFDGQIMVPDATIQGIFGDLPWEVSSEALMELLDGRRFRLTRPDGVQGFLVKKKDWVVFQPSLIHNSDIPMSLRYARAFQLQRRFMEPALPVFARSDEAPMGGAPIGGAPIGGAPIGGPSMGGPSMGGPSAGAGGSAAAAAGPEDYAHIQSILENWSQWYAFVSSGGTTALPPYFPDTMSIWSWLLQRYASAEAASVAFRWWFDHLPHYIPAAAKKSAKAGTGPSKSKKSGYEEQRLLYEFIITTPITDETPAAIRALATCLAPDIYRSSSIRAYRIFNPTTMNIEHWSLQPQDRVGGSLQDGPFVPAATTRVAQIDKALGSETAPIPAGYAGTLIGFMAPKAQKIVFKTQDRTKPGTKGAECGNTSTLGEHHPRIRLLQAAAATDAAIAPLMILDADEGYDVTRSGQFSAAPTHIKDISHQPLCLYLEFLTRMLDVRKTQGKRWFFGAVAAAQAGMRGRK